MTDRRAPLKTYKFEMGGMFVFYRGINLGEAIEAFVKHRPTYVKLIETITEHK